MLKVSHGRTPMLILFEILEMYKVPFRVVATRRPGKGYNRVHLITWWKQYAQILKWFRNSFRRRTKRAIVTWDKHLLAELELLAANSPTSLIYKKRNLLIELAAKGRVFSHFRWRHR